MSALSFFSSLHRNLPWTDIIHLLLIHFDLRCADRKGTYSLIHLSFAVVIAYGLRI